MAHLTYLTNTDWKFCDYVMVQAHRKLKDGTWTKASRWKWLIVGDVIEFSRRKENILTFCTIGHFEKPDKMSKQISNFCGDFDCQDNSDFEMARESCLSVLDYFGDLGLEQEHLRFWFTGGRGYHFEIPHQAFDFAPAVELNRMMKHLATHVNGYLTDDAYCENCLEVDLNIYKNPNQYRLPNSYRPDKSTYKIELSWEELRDLDQQQLMTLAAKPRPPLHDLKNITLEPIDDAKIWYQERLKEYHARLTQLELSEKTTPIKPKMIKVVGNNTTPIVPEYQQVTDVPAGIPVCIADLRQHGIKKAGDRNKATMLDATFCRDAGVPLVDAKTIINTWVQTIPIKMTGCKPGRERQAATSSTVEYIYNNGKYKFACSYAIGLRLHCNHKGCPLYKQTAFQKWGKNVRVMPDFQVKERPKQAHTVDDIRQQCAGKFKEFVLSDKTKTSAFFFHLLQGLGKTTTTLREARNLNDIRLLYGAPRHEIIDAFQAEGLINEHIYPRDQKHCKNCQLAGFYANKRYNVIRKLCAKKCDVGMEKCDYFKQFIPIFPGSNDGCVHEILYIQTYMEKLLEGEPESDIPTVVIFDEPEPQKFVETINITNKVVTEAINCFHSTGTKALLTAIRAAIEKLKQKDRFTGKKAMELILAEIPRDTTVEHLLETAKRYATIPDRCRAARFGAILNVSKNENAMLIAIGDKDVWVPADAFWVVDEDEKIMMVEPWLIEKENLSPLPDDGKLPLNFLEDLADTLSVELEKYKAGVDYNSLVTVGRLPGLKTPCLKLSKPKKLAIPEETKLVLLDGSGIPELLKTLTGREIETWAAPLQPDVEVTQITDGSYGITTLTNTKSKACENLITLAKQIAGEAPEDTVIFTWKKIQARIREKQAAGEFPMRVAVEHFGNIEGKNDYEGKKTAILLGTPTPNPQDIMELANAIWIDDALLDTESIKTDNWRAYQYVDAQGNGYAVEVREYKDPRLNIILHTYREQELVQAAHRIRPALYPGKRIFLLTNLPLDSLPPTRLTTVKELLTETSPEFKEFVALIKQIVKVHSGVWYDLLRKGSKYRNVISTIYLLHSGIYSLPTGGTLQRWFYKTVELLGYASSSLNFPTLGLAKPLKIYHNGSLGRAKIQALYEQISDKVVSL